MDRWIAGLIVVASGKLRIAWQLLIARHGNVVSRSAAFVGATPRSTACCIRAAAFAMGTGMML